MSTDPAAAPSAPHSCPICRTDHRRGVPPVCHEPDAPRPCTCPAGEALDAVAALASETVSVREAERAAELLNLFIRGRVADARRRERHAGIARDIRGVVGLPTKERP